MKDILAWASRVCGVRDSMRSSAIRMSVRNFSRGLVMADSLEQLGLGYALSTLKCLENLEVGTAIESFYAKIRTHL